MPRVRLYAGRVERAEGPGELRVGDGPPRQSHERGGALEEEILETCANGGRAGCIRGAARLFAGLKFQAGNCFFLECGL